MQIKPQDLTIKTFSTGTAWAPAYSGIEITHVPTNFIVRCGTERNQHKNKAIALEMLVKRLNTETDANKQLELF
jgi:peptide chain release factor 1